MPCFRCKAKDIRYQRLERSRIRFIRKAYPEFKDSHYLCRRCFQKFENTYQAKKKQKIYSASSSSMSMVTSRTLSSTSESKDSSHHTSQPTAEQGILLYSQSTTSSLDAKKKQKIYSASSSSMSMVTSRTLSSTSESKDSSHHTSQPTAEQGILLYSQSTTSSLDESIDSVDSLVHLTWEIPSLSDSIGLTQNPEVNIARQAAEEAERSSLRRRLPREPTKSREMPKRRRGPNSPMPAQDINDDVEQIAVDLPPNDLAHVRPIVKKRKTPVVYAQPDIMDIYLANTSGG